jgi:Mycothiol maleylpyruvate isomerase N-terminal domain
MTQVVTCIEPTPQAGNRRGHELADRLERGMRALAGLAATLTDEQWRLPVICDGRAVGVVVHHVASVYPLEVQLAETVAAGQPVVGVTMADVHKMNAQHAQDHAAASKDEAIALLLDNGTAAAAALRALSDEALGRAAPVSLYDDAELTSQFVFEDHAVRHSFHHLARIRATVG